VDLALAISLRPAGPPPDGHDAYAEMDGEDVLHAVCAALGALGPVRVWDTTTLGPADIAAQPRPDLIFNLAEGLAGTAREAHAPALFEWLQWPYVGSDPVTLAIAHDKWHTKRLLRAEGIATPAARLLTRPLAGPLAGLAFPVIVKPVAEGSGKGIDDGDVVGDDDALREVVRAKLARYRQPVLVEEFLPGREFTVGVIGNTGAWEALPLVEIDFAAIDGGRHRVFGYDAKWAAPTPRDLRCPVTLPAVLRAAIERAALDTCEALGVRDWARVDVRLDAAGRPGVLDVNPLPGIMPGDAGDISCFTRAAYEAGLKYDALIHRLVDTALERYRAPSFFSYRSASTT
jgi:D-alanine-D-alanine ligase